MKKIIFISTMLFFSVLAIGQNSSAGISIGSFIFNDGQNTSTGIQYNVNVRAQISERFGWQTEVSYAYFDEKITRERFFEEFNVVRVTTEEFRNTFTFLKSSITAKLFNIHGLTGEIAIGPGLYKSYKADELRGLAHSEFFLSSKITDKLVVGLPISYDFVFWDRDHFYSVGASIRYHL